jgi:hypothetical protein
VWRPRWGIEVAAIIGSAGKGEVILLFIFQVLLVVLSIMLADLVEKDIMDLICSN